MNDYPNGPSWDEYRVAPRVRVVRAARIAALNLVVALVLAACVGQSIKPTTTLDYLGQAEAVLAAGWTALGNAIELGTVQLNSEQHKRFWNALERADSLLDQAWQVYAGGDDSGARLQADTALRVYAQIRPALLAAGGR